MKLQQLLSYTRKAIDDYALIEEGDKIAVGISGGKDSLALLYALAGLRRFYPKKFTLEAISVHLGYEELNLTPIAELCEVLEVPFTIVPSTIADIIFNQRKEKNPCSLCAKMRKGAFNEKAKELGCNKVALAHHKDDIIETSLMSLVYEGRYYAFPPKTYLDRMDLTVIRPLLYVTEANVIGFKNLYELPVQKNPCPADGYTKREYIKNLIKQLEKENPGVKDRLFHAVTASNIKGWTMPSDESTRLS